MRTDGVGNNATLNVNLSPGSNTLVIGVTNTDNSLWGSILNFFQSPVTVTVTLTVSGPNGTVTEGPEPFNEGNGLPLYLNPGQEFTRGASGFVGPGTATVGFVNQSPYTLGVVLISTPQQCPQSGCR